MKSMGKRILLFVAVNFLVIATLSIVLNVLGVQPYITEKGLNFEQLLIFATIWGFGGAFISLALSKVMAKWMMGVQILDPQKALGHERWLIETVYRHARQAGLSKMPEVGIYDSPDINAFATGPSRSNSLVAVSTGLLHSMNQAEVEGVIGHEVAHVANGDMVTMTLIQGVVNAFVMVLARVLGFFISQGVREEARQTVHMITVIVLEILFSFLGMFVVAWFSRQREYRADKGGAALAGREKMISALRALKNNFEPHPDEQNGAMASLKISGSSGGWMRFLSTHPSLDDRISRLERGYR